MTGKAETGYNVRTAFRRCLPSSVWRALQQDVLGALTLQLQLDGSP